MKAEAVAAPVIEGDGAPKVIPVAILSNPVRVVTAVAVLALAQVLEDVSNVPVSLVKAPLAGSRKKVLLLWSFPPLYRSLMGS